MVQAGAEDKVRDGAGFTGFVTVPDHGKKDATVRNDRAAVASFFIAGNGVAFPESCWALCRPMICERFAVRQGAISEWAAPLGPIGRTGDRKAEWGEESEEEGALEHGFLLNNGMARRLRLGG